MYNPTYTRTKKGNFNSNRAMASIFAGTDAFLLEDEVNEMQWIQNEARASVIRKLISSGFHTKGNIQAPIGANLNSILLDTCESIVNGYEVYIANNGNRTDLKNMITLSGPPTTDTRKDFVFLEVWFQDISTTDSLYAYGGVESGVLTNDLMDVRIGQETSRRIQLRWRIRVVDDVNATTYPNGMDDTIRVKAWGGNTADTLYVFTKNGTVYVSGNGSDVAEASLKAIGGYVYAIPMFMVGRYNRGVYNVSTNTNGAPIYVDVSSTSTRPDGRFSNLIYEDQVVDLRFQSESKVLSYFKDNGSNISLNKDLVINGTTTTINTAELNIADNIVRLNSDLISGTPTENAGVEVLRGDLPAVTLRWNESSDKWQATIDGTTYFDIILSNQKGVANGVPSLDANVKIPFNQLPALPNPVTYTVSKDGRGDYTNIPDAIAAMPVGGGMIYVREGIYDVDGFSIGISNITIVGQGASTIIKMLNGSAITYLVQLNSVSNFVLKNLKLDVNRDNIQATGGQYALHLNNCNHITIDNIYIENAKDCVYLDSTANSSIKDCIIKNATGSGIYDYGDPINSGKDANEISSNKIENCVIGIQLDTNSKYDIVTNNVLRSCTSGIINSGSSNIVNNNIIR